MTLLHLLSYVATVAGCLFVTLSLASGLLWLSELIEEHTKMAKIIGTRAIYTIILVHIALYLFDSLPFKLIAFSIVCHLIYLQNFSHTWPFISLVSPTFIGSCVLVIVDHFLWFHYFAQRTQDSRTRRPARVGAFAAQEVSSAPGFMDIAAFFGMCVWLVPLFLFLSLSANDNTLPTGTSSGSAPSTPKHGNDADLNSPTASRHFRFPRKSLLATIVDPIFDTLPFLRMRRGSRRSPEGIIAPRTPTRSPLQTPLMNHTAIPPWTPSGNGDTDLLSPPINGHQFKGFGSEIRRTPVANLRSPPPPVRRQTAPPTQQMSFEMQRSESDPDLSRPGLGIRPQSRLGRRAVHAEEDLELSRSSSPIMR